MRTRPRDAQQKKEHAGRGRGALLPDRDRLLAAWDEGPRLSDSDAEMIDRVVREAREASLGDTVPH